MAFVSSCTATLATSKATTNQATKRVLLTGSNVAGIGGETALGLVRALPTLEELYLCARDENKANAVAERVKRIAPVKLNVNVVSLDLASMESTRKCAKEVHEKLAGEPLDVAIFNAGVMACPLNYTSEELEYQFGVNHVAHAMLALSLERTIRRSVYVSSTAVGIARARTTPPTIAEKSRSSEHDSKYSRWPAYGDSKLAMSMFAKAMALDGLDAVSLHPGIVNTELMRHNMSPAIYNWSKKDGPLQDALRGVFSTFGFKTPAQGAKLSLKLATDPPGAYHAGALYLDKNRTAPQFFAPLLSNDDLCRQVKEDTVKFCEKYVSENEQVPLLLESTPATA